MSYVYVTVSYIIMKNLAAQKDRSSRYLLERNTLSCNIILRKDPIGRVRAYVSAYTCALLLQLTL